MKKTAILLTLLILITFSCKKDYRFFAFYIDKKVQFTIPHGTSPLTQIEFDNQEILTSSAAIFEDKFTSSELIEEITIESAYIDSSKYRNLSDLDIFISAEGQSEVLLANNDSVSSFYRISGMQYLEYLEFNSTTDILDEYIKSDKIRLRTTGELLEGTTKDEGIILYFRFLVKAYVK